MNNHWMNHQKESSSDELSQQISANKTTNEFPMMSGYLEKLDRTPV